MAALDGTQRNIFDHSDSESQNVMDKVFEVYEDLCKKQKIKNAPDKDELRTMMMTHHKKKTQKVIPPSKYIIHGKVDARVLKKVTLTASMMKPSKKKQSRILALPYLPESIDYSKCCQAIVLNGYLFTPCLESPAKDSECCRTCIRNGLKYGLLSDRKDCEIGKYVQPKGKKKEILYGEFLKKQNITIEKVVERIEMSLGPELAEYIIIPDEYLKLPVKIKKKRGRPARERKVIVDADEILSQAEDYTSQFMSIPEGENEDESEMEKEPKKAKKDEGAAEEKAEEDDGSETEDEHHKFDYDGLTFRLFVHDGKKYVYDDDDMEIYEVMDIPGEDGNIMPKLDGFSVGEWNWAENKPEFYREVTPDESDVELEEEEIEE